MSLHDARGCPTSTRNAVSLQRYEQALDLSVSYFLDPLATIQQALEEEPDFVMGHCLQAGLMILSSDRAAVPQLAQCVKAGEALAGHANDRERAHLGAARTWLEGDFATAVARYGDILLDYPHDLLALQIAHVGDFFLGASSMLRDRIAQVLPVWTPCMPGYGYVLGMYAFGLEETALYTQAEEAARRALSLNPRDPWAVHAAAHVMEMQGRLHEGIEWLSGSARDWAPNNGLAVHNWWHLALFHMDLGHYTQVLELYDQCIGASDSHVPLEMIDASALLWRLHSRGIDAGSRWQDLVARWEPCLEDAYYAFNDVHAVMAFAGAHRFDLAQRTVDAMTRKAGQADTNAMMTKEVGLPLACAIVAFAAEHYRDAVSLLLPIRTIASRFGGSHAQRDLIHLTLVEAALRAGQAGLARALIAERTQLRPDNPFNRKLAARVREMAGGAAHGERSPMGARLAEAAR